VPPGLLHDPAAPETLEGERILAEYPDDRGVLLWQSYRDGLLWAGTRPEKRRGLFQGESAEHWRKLLGTARLDATMLRALQALHAGLRAGRDAGAAVARAALSLALGAVRDEAGATAIAFAQLASILEPAAAAPAVTVGGIALGFGRTAVAETWLRRAIGLARRGRDWAAYGRALIALAGLRERTGQPAAAQVELRKALRLARRRSLPETRTRALHGLLRIAIRDGDYAAAEQYARGARRGYGHEHPELGSLELDVAELALRLGDRARAAVLLRKALPSRESAGDQVRGLIMLVRAAADRPEVEEAWHHAAELIADTYGSSPDAARLLLELARASAEIHEERHADMAAARALACATQLGCAALAEEVSAFLARPRLARATD